MLDRCSGHPCVVQLLDVFASPPPTSRIHLVFELWGKDLAAVAHGSSSFSPQQLRAVASEVLSELCHLHGSGVIHGDLKPANILARDGGGDGLLRCKLADVGCAVEVSHRTAYILALHATMCYGMFWHCIMDWARIRHTRGRYT